MLTNSQCCRLCFILCKQRPHLSSRIFSMASPNPSQKINWNIYQGSGFVSIHSRHVFLSVQGPPRSPGQPVVICEAGHESTSYVWAAVQSQASQFIRTFAYDRAGMGQSEPGPGPRTAAVAARDLSDVLDAAGIGGPYIVVCHSYGGMIAREFFHIRGKHIAGMIFVDAISEHYSSDNPLPMAEFGAVLGGLDFWDICGMTKRHTLGHEEWELVIKQWPNDESTSASEASVLVTSEKELGEKRQFDKQAMGDRPVTVIKGNATQDFKHVLAAGEAVGNGTESQLVTLREYIKTSEATREKHQREQMKLSRNSRYVVAEHGYHTVQLSQPELVVAEIKNILEQLTA